MTFYLTNNVCLNDKMLSKVTEQVKEMKTQRMRSSSETQILQTTLSADNEAYQGGLGNRVWPGLSKHL